MTRGGCAGNKPSLSDQTSSQRDHQKSLPITPPTPVLGVIPPTMAMQSGQAFQEKVARMLSKEHGKALLKPNKPLVLKDEVANRKMKKGEATCITEMTTMMACWKQNNFVDALCSTEMRTFYTCVEKAQLDSKARASQSKMQGGRLPPKQASALLRRYPNHRTEV
ncbi:coiled-coil-helix-coiled-coil-helix domain-containing protein 1 [Gadus macrocephalus]|uniref:coiled-coil-helix-coiled-coil-helix domain-containing protein 1 n=1 Tax=Gadus macrocephalus TaxID=80720 RepID=UPI0028CBB39E|nr:coiled-coil-helix-coiled-coil-helix domain-containing protein 1 [Gadus macrocephalus]